MPVGKGTLTKMEKSVEKEVEKNDFIPREYQEKIAEMAIGRNIIIFLPTGSGKTFVSTIVINHFLQKNDCARKELGRGGKRGFFLVNTVALVHQQKEQLLRNGPFSVKGYSGDMGVDHWCKSVWDLEFENYQILVMTAQIFLNLLLGHILTLKDVAVIVFDECHHGVMNHPMRQIMQEFKDISEKDQPRVVGLTATLINKTLPVHKVDEEIAELEKTFLAQIATADDENMVKMYSTNPKEFIVNYRPNDLNKRIYTVRDQFVKGYLNYILFLQINDEEKADKSIRPRETFQIEDRSCKTNKDLKNVMADIQVNMDELGVYAGQVAVLARIIQLQKFIFNNESEVVRTALRTLMTDLTFLRKYFYNEMCQLSEKEKLLNHLSDKVQKLFGVLKRMKKDDCAIVFVRRRFTAKIMHQIVSTAAKVIPQLNHINCDFIVGYNVTNPFKDTRENLLQRNYNNRALDKFNAGLLNVLFGSSVVEEGMDIQKCNMVIMFDTASDFRSYTQSKGRARHSESTYITFSCDPKYREKHEKFQVVENRLQSLLCGGEYKNRLEPGKEDIDASLFAKIPGLEPYKPRGENGPSITALSAISHINRYFSTLKTDKFSKITPFWFIKTEGNKSRCFLHLPMESKVRGLVEGTWQNNKENAKRSVALEACKVLHKHGELENKHLLPITPEFHTINSHSFMPKWDSEEKFVETVNGKDVHLGTKNNKRGWEKKWPVCLSGCMPKAGAQVYLHVLEIKLMYLPPADNHRLVAFHRFMSEPVTYAIVSSKPLPQVAPFPLYMSTGELEVNVITGKTRSFTEEELKKISMFHGLVFYKVVDVVNTFLIRDYSNSQNSYLIAPVITGANGVDIDWGVIEKITRPFPDPRVRPTDEQRMNLEVNDENYLGKIVFPWYRTAPAQKYIVTKVCYDMNENSDFPSDVYATYKDYFLDKYNIEPLKQQPLIEVRAISSRLNNLKPISLTKSLKRKGNDENEEFEVWLLPEFCHVYPVPGWYWVKAQLLPSVLHRVTQLCAAEELRVRLVKDTGIGLSIIPPGHTAKKLEADASLSKHVQIETTQLLTPLTSQMKSHSLTSKSISKLWEKEDEPVDIDRDMDVLLFDIRVYEKFVNAPLHSQQPKGNIFNQLMKKEALIFVTPPPLKMLEKRVQGTGPEQVQMLQAITAAVANDFISCERLETLGDSYLKFAISLMLFETQEDLPEGALTTLKGQIVGNKNLYFCGKIKNLGNMLEMRELSPREEWIPPQFCVERKVQATIIDALLDPSCLYNITIPEEEVFEGRISANTQNKFSAILLNSEDLLNIQTCTFTNQLGLTDKNVSDAVEAILGVYVENSGIFGALRVMNWFGVTDPSLATDRVFTERMTKPTRGTHGSLMDHLLLPDDLEDTLNYKFQDRAYLLQALSHPSYQRNNITQCYQRLEFLGDAIIDFLITVHIYERCTELHPGDLTDLRSALVNNITLGSLAVRHGLHRYLLHRSTMLNDIITRFVKHQEERGHLIDNDILFLIEENETNISEAIEVPKALGDVFEALIGAVYLDSGKDLGITWKIIYNLMKDEIEKFHTDVPKNHVRMLYESKCGPSFSSSLQSDGVVTVSVEVQHEGNTITSHGFGDNKHQAKRAAAKQALRLIRGSVDK